MASYILRVIEHKNIIQQYIEIVSQMSPHQYLQNIRINPQDTTHEPSTHIQAININIHIADDSHTIKITQHTNPTTSSQLTLHIKHHQKHKTPDKSTNTTTPQTHQHRNIWVKPTNPLTPTTIHCAHISILHPQPTQIPWTETTPILHNQLCIQIVAAVLLHYINPQLEYTKIK